MGLLYGCTGRLTAQNGGFRPGQDTNTFPGACFFPQNILKHGVTPMFLRNSMYNYGEWEMTSKIWQQGASVTPDWGSNNGCGKLANGSCASNFGEELSPPRCICARIRACHRG
jgi:hypothetical protein